MAILVASLPLDMTNFLADFSEDGDDVDLGGKIRSDYPDGSFQFYFYSPAPLSAKSALIGFEHFLPGGAQAVGLSQLSVPILTYVSYADRNDATGLTAFMFRGNDLLYANQEGDDVLLGFAGNDTFFHVDAGDALVGGAGVDVLAFIAGSGPPQAVDLDDSFFRFKTQVESVELRADAADHNIVLGERSEFAGISMVSARLLGAASSVTLDASARSLAIQLTGSAGNDTLLGGGGKDTLAGGAGDDTYRVGTGDVITESAGAGFDEVFSADTFTLSPNLERLTLTGTADAGATGNSGINTLIGNSGNNRLDGGAGADTLTGGAGNDTYVLNGADIIEVDPGGNDTVETAGTFDLRVRSGGDLENVTLVGALAVNATGNEFANVLKGNGVANTLDGGGGADDLQGGLGNDTYLVDNAGDLVTEALRSGTDIVKSTVSATLSANVEHLTLLAGAGAINATGNALANLLLGNESANRLDGLGGADDLRGGLGDDTYVVDSAADKVTELLNQGTDTVESLISLALVLNAENLTLIGSANLAATGNTGANTLSGNAGNNILSGLAGSDSLVGGLGDDTLVGGLGQDTLEGGLGNDLYILEPAGDTLIEAVGEGADTVQIGRSVDLTTEFDNVENVTLSVAVGLFNLTGDEADNVLKGNNSANRLVGNAGNDRLEGGAGVDTLDGGLGDDTYVLNGVDLIEIDDGGNDTIEVSTHYLVLRDDLENITLLGTAAFNATGNASANTLKGNSAGNILDAKEGVDRMEGGAGNDIYFVDDTNDIVTEALNGGADKVNSSATYALSDYVEILVLTGIGNFDGTGNALNNTITGNTGHNRLDGGLGNDTMAGGLGDDTYVVDSTLDKITESLNAGEDTVEAWVSHTLATHVDHLKLMGTALTATGNALANQLTGNDANNTLDGKVGADTMSGGLGNDFYVLDNVGDSVFEETGGGSDTVQVGYTARSVEEIKLGSGMYAHIENVTITGTGVFNLTGDDGDNLLTGNGSANVLVGGVGDDVLVGQGGADTMLGADGNDIYYVDSIGDQVVEGNLQEFEVQLVSTLSNGDQSGRDSNWPTISGDGRLVAFESPSRDFSTPTSTFNPHLFLKDIETGVLTKINDPLPDAQNPIAPGSSRNAILSGDGSVVGFTSIDPYLVRANPGIFDENVYASETSGDFGITLVSQNNGQFTTEGFAYLTDVSYDGRYFIYTGNDPDVIGPDGNNTAQDVVVVDRSAGEITVANFTGTSPTNPFTVYNTDGRISGDGRYVGFSTNTPDLTTYVLNGKWNVFVRDLHEQEGIQAFKLVSTSSSGVQANKSSRLVDLSGDGRYVLFNSDATNLVAGDTNGQQDVFLKDTQTGQTMRVSTSAQGVQSNGLNVGYGVSADGRYVLFSSSASNLAPVDPAGMGGDLYVKDVMTGLVAIVSRSEQGLSMPNALGGYAGADLSEDGRYIAFKSPATLAPGSGSGIYRVTNPLFQTASEGIDEVRSTISYTLGAGIENLTLLGTAIGGTGNELANVITGNSAANILTGGAGADTLNGGLGTDTLRGGADNDTYYVDVATDKVEEGSDIGSDTVHSSAPAYTLPVNTEALVLDAGSANLNGTGNAGANSLTGNAGNNILDGKAGADSMAGGGGDDTYFVENADDLVIESSGGGTDVVKTELDNYALTDNVENLLLLGSAIHGSGNTLANSIIGNVAANLLYGLEGDDVLDGSAGSDFMFGGAGDDVYFFDVQNDVATEAIDEGDDTVKTSVTLDRLDDNVENVLLLGTKGLGAKGNDLDNILTGNAGANVLTGEDGQDTLLGLAGNDSLSGGEGNDILLGGAGTDTLRGNQGNDSYYVDSTLDKVIEADGEGDSDKVFSSASLTGLAALATNVENLALTGSAALNGTGNAEDNTIEGNSGNNILLGGDGDDELLGMAGNDSLNGQTGADDLAGGAGDDLYTIDESDTVIEAGNEGVDTVQAAFTILALAANVEKLVLLGTAGIHGSGNELNNTLTGNAGNNELSGGLGNDTLVGNAGNDILDGDAGNDAMQGGVGNDVYYVDSALDIVIEAAAAGTDEVRSSADFVLGANIEYLVLTGTDDIDGTGNALANRIAGNSGHNILDGKAGADEMLGGMGDDHYFVDNSGDRAVETDFSHGTDTVHSVINFLMGSLIENLILEGSSAISGTGNELDNVIFGNGAANRIGGFHGDDLLDGGGGADFLSGDLGNDTFVFDPIDTLIDGSLGSDTVKLTGSGMELVVAGVTAFKSIEVFDITGSGDNNLYITAAKIASLSDDDRIQVLGNAGDSVRSADQGWLQGADQMENGITYHTYSMDGASLWVDADISLIIS